MAADPTCVMQPFSYSTTSHFFTETHEEKNPIMYGIEESISFGRYVCEDLEWEKWSSFNTSNNRNRYVEEAEKYSKPGSVAQKKAYFEAHFKRMAALKAAALLEQANDSAAQVNNTSSNENVKPQINQAQNLLIEANNYEQIETVGKDCKKNETGEFVVHQNELYLAAADDEQIEHDLNDGNGKEVDPTPPPPPPPPNHKLSHKIEITKDENIEVRNEIIKTHMNEPPFQKEKTSAIEEPSTKVAVRKKNPPLSSFILSSSSPVVDGRGNNSSDNTFLFAPSPAKSATISDAIYPGKENYATPIKNCKSSISCDLQKKKTPLRMSINREFNRILSPVIKKLGSSSKASTPSKTPAKASMNSIPQQPPPMTPNRGATSPSTGRSKISSPIIPNSFCLTGDRTTRRKQRLEEKFDAATATEKAPQPSKFKEKAEAELNKFRQSFCFKAMSSPDYYGDSGTFKSPQHKRESPARGRQPNNKTSSQNKSDLPPRRPSMKQIGLRSKRTPLAPT